MSVGDLQVGRNVVALRGEMSQKELAERMRSLGWKWVQATVWNVEKGERPLRIGEAEDLAEMFGVSVTAMTIPAKFTSLMAALRSMRRVGSSLDKMAREYERERARLAQKYELVMQDIDQSSVQEIEAWLRTSASESIDNLGTPTGPQDIERFISLILDRNQES